MRVAFLIAIKDLRQRFRDRTALLVSIAAPLGLAVIFSQLLAGTTDFHARYVVADMDGGELGRVLRQDVIGSLENGGVADITDAPTEAAARAAVEDGSADAAFLVPAGFTMAIQAGQAATLEVVGAQDAGLATEIARAVAQRFGDGVVTVQLAVATALDLRGPLTPDPALQARIVGAVSSASQPVVLVDETADLRQLTLPAYFSASMAIMFLFFAAQIGLVTLFEERRQGTLARVLAGPVRPWTVLAGKTLGSFVLGVLSMTVLVIATTVLVRADWGPPLGVALMLVAAVIAAVGISTLVISFTRSAEAAGAASSAVAITLAILGGSFSPTATAPEVMATVALATPHGWFMHGLAEMAGPAGSVTDGLSAVGVLLVMGLVCGSIGLARARRLVRIR